METKNVKRFDKYDLAKWMSTPFRETPDGFLTGRAVVTSCGVFSYRRPDGVTIAELRLPEEVFNRESLDSMKLKPLTNDHPAALVTPETAQAVTVGSLGADPSSWTDSYSLQYPEERGRGSSGSDGIHVSTEIIVTDAAAIADIKAGKRALSMGYECDIEEASGVWAGVAYDAIQRNIRYNHCAIVDAADAILTSGTSREEKSMGVMKKINLDGIEYEGEEKLVEAYVAEKKRADAAETALDKGKAVWDDSKKALSKTEADRDTQKERADKAEAKVKELEEARLDSKALDAAIAARVELLEAAARAGVEVKKDMADIEVKKAVILACYPKANFDGKDDTYIQARYDAAVETLAEKADGIGRQVLGGDPFLGGVDRVDSIRSREKMIADLKARSRGSKKDE